LLELCPDQETRALFTDAPVASPHPEVPPPKPPLPGQEDLERRYLDPAFLNSLPAETRELYKGTVENILQLSAMKMKGNKVAAEGLRLLAETIIQMAGKATETQGGGGRQAKGHSELIPAPQKRNE
jgi:hypothetical protein